MPRKINDPHRDYKRRNAQFTYAWDHYEIEPILRDLDKAAVNQNVSVRSTSEGITRKQGRAYSSKYLHMHAQAESGSAFQERAKITNVAPLFASAVDTLAGIFFSVEHEANRVFQPEGATGLGDPNDTTTTIGRLWENIDGGGMNYDVQLKQRGVRLIVLHEYWTLIEGIPRGEDGEGAGEAMRHLIDPRHVINWREERGKLVEVVLKEEHDVRRSIFDDDEPQTQYVHYELDGFTRYVPDEEGEYVADKMGKQPYGPDSFQYVDRAGQPRLPVRRDRLALDRNVGYLAAREANTIMNQESARDFLLWIANFTRFLFDYKEAGINIEQLKEWITEGLASVLPGVNHEFISPPIEPITIATEVIEKKTKAFFDHFYQQLNDAAREKTATEIRMDQRDLEAFMILFRDTMDEAENDDLWLLSQIYFPGQPDIWAQASVKRADSFQPTDMESVTERAWQRFFGGERVPVDVETLLELIKRMVEFEGIVVDEAREELLREAVRKFIIQGQQMSALPRLRDRLRQAADESVNGVPETEEV